MTNQTVRKEIEDYIRALAGDHLDEETADWLAEKAAEFILTMPTLFESSHKIGFNHAILMAAELVDDILNNGKTSSVGEEIRKLYRK